MNDLKLQIFWTQNAKEDLKEIYLQLKSKYSKETTVKIRDELFGCADNVTFSEQFQLDEYRLDCRRIIIRNYKVLYQINENTIYIVRIFNSFQNPLKSLK